ISLSTEFLAPGTAISPASGPTRRTSIRQPATLTGRTLPRVLGRSRTVTRAWPDGPGVADRLCSPRADLLTEQAAGDGTFAQVTGPFSTYERRLAHDGHAWRETTRYRLAIPWFGWLFAWPVRMVLARRLSRLWWAPPDHITPRHAL